MKIELKPCPWCGDPLERTESWAKSFQPNKLCITYRHPENGCIAERIGHSAIEVPDADRKFEEAWNHRAPLTTTAEPGEGEAARIAEDIQRHAPDNITREVPPRAPIDQSASLASFGLFTPQPLPADRKGLVRRLQDAAAGNSGWIANLLREAATTLSQATATQETKP